MSSGREPIRPPGSGGMGVRPSALPRGDPNPSPPPGTGPVSRRPGGASLSSNLTSPFAPRPVGPQTNISMTTTSNSSRSSSYFQNGHVVGLSRPESGGQRSPSPSTTPSSFSSISSSSSSSQEHSDVGPLGMLGDDGGAPDLRVRQADATAEEAFFAHIGMPIPKPIVSSVSSNTRLSGGDTSTNGVEPSRRPSLAQLANSIATNRSNSSTIPSTFTKNTPNPKPTNPSSASHALATTTSSTNTGRTGSGSGTNGVNVSRAGGSLAASFEVTRADHIARSLSCIEMNKVPAPTLGDLVTAIKENTDGSLAVPILEAGAFRGVVHIHDATKAIIQYISPRLLTVIRNAVAVITTRPQLPANTSSHLDEEYVNRELEAELERQEDDLWADRRPVSPRVAKEHIADLQHALAKALSTPLGILFPHLSSASHVPISQSPASSASTASSLLRPSTYATPISSSSSLSKRAASSPLDAFIPLITVERTDSALELCRVFATGAPLGIIPNKKSGSTIGTSLSSSLPSSYQSSSALSPLGIRGVAFQDILSLLLPTHSVVPLPALPPGASFRFDIPRALSHTKLASLFARGVSSIASAASSRQSRVASSTATTTSSSSLPQSSSLSSSTKGTSDSNQQLSAAAAVFQTMSGMTTPMPSDAPPRSMATLSADCLVLTALETIVVEGVSTIAVTDRRGAVLFTLTDSHVPYLLSPSPSHSTSFSQPSLSSTSSLYSASASQLCLSLRDLYKKHKPAFDKTRESLRLSKASTSNSMTSSSSSPTPARNPLAARPVDLAQAGALPWTAATTASSSLWSVAQTLLACGAVTALAVVDDRGFPLGSVTFADVCAALCLANDSPDEAIEDDDSNTHESTSGNRNQRPSDSNPTSLSSPSHSSGLSTSPRSGDGRDGMNAIEDFKSKVNQKNNSDQPIRPKVEVGSGTSLYEQILSEARHKPETKSADTLVTGSKFAGNSSAHSPDYTTEQKQSQSLGERSDISSLPLELISEEDAIRILGREAAEKILAMARPSVDFAAVRAQLAEIDANAKDAEEKSERRQVEEGYDLVVEGRMGDPEYQVYSRGGWGTGDSGEAVEDYQDKGDGEHG